MDLMMFAILLFAIAQLADVITTNQALDRGGVEMNPFIKWTMGKFGKAWPIIKLAIASFGVYLLYLGNLPWLIIALAVLVGYVAYRNHNVARK